MDALQILLITVRDKKWCVKPYCTTCGAREYRQEIHDKAVPLVDALKAARLDNLRHEFRGIHFDDALRLMLMELAQPFGPLLGVTLTVDCELAGSEAGEYLARMRRHEERLVAERARRERYASPEAAAERRRLKAERQLATQAERADLKRQRDEKMAHAIEAFARLTARDASNRILEGAVGFPVYRLPETLVEAICDLLPAMTNAELERLRERVPVTRTVPLAKLSSGIAAEWKARFAEVSQA